MKLRNKLAKVIAITMIGIMSVTCYASELPVLTLQQAISAAQSADSLQQEAYRTSIAANKQRQIDSNDVSTASYQSSYFDQLNTEQTQKYHKDAVIYNATKSYNSIALLEKKVAFCDKKLALQEKLLSQSELKYNKGLVSKLDFDKEQTAIEEQRTAKDKLQTQLDQERAEFKILTNYDTTKYEVEGNFEVEYYRPVGNVQYMFNTAVNEMVQYDEKIAKASEMYGVSDLFKVGDHSAISYYNNTASVAQTKNQLKETKDKYLSSLNNLYYSLATLEQNMKELEATIQDKEKALEAIKLKLDKGLISEIDVEKAELELEERQLELVSYKVQYNAARDAVKTPWANFY